MPSGPNQAAALTVKLATEELGPSPVRNEAISQYLATIGKKGGIKGGKARAEKLTAKRRSEIARNAAKTRWSDQER
jgi:hypothetical protein